MILVWWWHQVPVWSLLKHTALFKTNLFAGTLTLNGSWLRWIMSLLDTRVTSFNIQSFFFVIYEIYLLRQFLKHTQTSKASNLVFGQKLDTRYIWSNAKLAMSPQGITWCPWIRPLLNFLLVTTFCSLQFKFHHFKTRETSNVQSAEASKTELGSKSLLWQSARHQVFSGSHRATLYRGFQCRWCATSCQAPTTSWIWQSGCCIGRECLGHLTQGSAFKR